MTTASTAWPFFSASKRSMLACWICLYTMSFESRGGVARNSAGMSGPACWRNHLIRWISRACGVVPSLLVLPSAAAALCLRFCALTLGDGVSSLRCRLLSSEARLRRPDSATTALDVANGGLFTPLGVPLIPTLLPCPLRRELAGLPRADAAGATSSLPS
jgi:hypothetical protein